MNQKPAEILELEKVYDVVLQEIEYDLTTYWSQRNTYSLKEEEVIAINLKANNINKIQGFHNLPKLEYLSLGNNKINKIENLSGLKNLKHLNLEFNEISKIENLNSLLKIQHLSLENNKIDKIDNLENLTEMLELDLTHNNISKLENINGLKKVQHLYLSYNKIYDIKILKKLDGLLVLYLHNNHIADISGLKNTPNLRELELSHNGISEISNLKKLSKLEVLRLKYNNIIDISGLRTLLNLEELDLSYNWLKDFFSLNIVLELEKLKRLFINNNPLEVFNNFILNSHENHLQLILSKLKELEEHKTKITLPTKVMLLGNHAAGKSTFLEYLQTGKIINKNKSTPILKIEDYPIGIKKGLLPKAIIYDFGGQDYYHGLYQAFFSLDTVNLLLWNTATDKNDIRKDSNNIDTRDFKKGYWLAQLHNAFKKERKYHTKASEEPTFLIQTHADIDNKITWENKKEIQQVTNEFYVSLHKDVALKMEVNKASLYYLRASVKDAIEQKLKQEEKPIWYKPFLNYVLDNDSHTSTNLDVIINQYKRTKLSKDKKLTFLREDLQQLALKGMILYYKEDEDLKNVAWLNPAKTVEHIHNNILTDALIAEKKGILTLKEWETICDLKNIERLLIKEKVVFYDKHDKQYIIPNYLGLSKDDKRYELLKFGFLKSNFTLKFKYFIPFGIINQLICRFGNNPNYKAFWRDQLIFTYDEAKVFIKLDFERLQISVYIQHNKPAELEEELFGIILKLYNNEDELTIDGLHKKNKFIEKEFLKPKIVSADYMEKKNTEVKYLRQKIKYDSVKNNAEYFDKWVRYFSKYNSPDDMYLSVDGKYFVHHKTLENSELTQTRISAYPLNKEGEIDNTKPKEQSSILYTNFTNNDKIKQMKKIFISYSRKDVDYKNELKKHLGMLRLFDIADTWSCEDISIGKWDTQIQKELEESDLIIYMLSANFFSSRYIIEKEVANIMKEIENGKQKDILCVIVSDFVGVETLRNPNDDRPTTALQNALLELAAHQYLPYDTITNKTNNNTEEKIIPLKVHTNRNTIESALTQIVSKVREKLQ